MTHKERTMIQDLKIAKVDINAAALILESGIIVKEFEIAGAKATQMNDPGGEFVVIQGSGDSFLILR